MGEKEKAREIGEGEGGTIYQREGEGSVYLWRKREKERGGREKESSPSSNLKKKDLIHVGRSRNFALLDSYARL